MIRKKLDEKASEFIFGDDLQHKSTGGSKKIQKQSNELIDKLTKEPDSREKPIRVSLDLTPEMHAKLTKLANRTGRKKKE